MNNQECRTRTKIININNNEPVFYPISFKANKCSGSCNNINDPYAKLCVPDVVKNINVKVFNLISRSNKTRHIERHETCKCKCKLNSSVCNNKQKWNEEKCRCECKELTDKGKCDKRFIWNPSNCDCECGKSCDIREYLDYKNCKGRRKVVDNSFEECIDENEVIYNGILNDHKKVCSSCTTFIVLFVIFLIISTIISGVFIYFHCYLKRKNTNARATFY